MDEIKEVKNKLQCQKCHKPYKSHNSYESGWIHIECKHLTCGMCTNTHIPSKTRCPVCAHSTRITPIPFVHEMLSTLKNYEDLFEKYEETETKLLDAVSILKEKEAMCEAAQENHYKCVECGTSDSEQNLQLCETCHGLKFEDKKDVMRNALCAVCAIKKHIRQGHKIVDFYPYLSAYNFSSQSSEIDSKSEEFESARDSLSNTFSHFKDLSISVKENYNVLTDMARRSKSTKNQVGFFEKMEKFINESKSINVQTDSEVKKQAAKLETNLKNIKEWYEVRMENCVDESEIIKLTNSDNNDFRY